MDVFKVWVPPREHLSVQAEQKLFEVWELIPLAMMMICRTFISKTLNRSNSGSGRAREEPKKGQSSKYNSQDDEHIREAVKNVLAEFVR